MAALRLPQSQNRRLEITRYRLVGEFPGKILFRNREELVNIRGLDVSRRGLGFVAAQPLTPGTTLILILGKVEFTVEVIYCQSHLGIENIYRCGIFIRDPDINLIERLTTSGCVGDEIENPDIY